MTTDVSIVVPAYNNWWLTRRCLQAVEEMRSATSVRFETIVVDNGSSDETAEQLARTGGIRSLRLDPNANFGGAANAGARIANAPIVLFLNNDAWPLGDALTPLAESFQSPGVAIAGAALFYEDGVTQGAGCVLLPNAHWFLSCRNLPASLDTVRRSRDAIVVPGAALAVRKEWFLASGGFDPIFRNGFEDTDLCMRAHSEGLVTRYVAEARFAHYEGATVASSIPSNELAFYRRWSQALADIPRVERGEVGAIVLRRGKRDALSDAVLDDVLEAVAWYGHPVVTSVAPWQRFDRRFRTAATLAWNCDGAAYAPCVEVCVSGASARLRTHGVVDLEVPWMPCADPARAQGRFAGKGDAFGYGALVDAYSGALGAEAARDARRRGSPRRSVMRVLDLARVARFGFERPGRAVSNAPLKLSA